ncbi:MAG: hypothetical protein QM772_15205 [Ottowia sp.]|uniref:hypothetical protein n=1 Tax=Ottowia sp. TaxID=1898956 RepID=UPI0039E24A44
MLLLTTGATVLCRVTIGGNVRFTRSVPPESYIAQGLARDCGSEDDGLAMPNPCK